MSDLTDLERFFRDPDVGDGLLQPPLTGPACANVRAALNRLGDFLGHGDVYDDELAAGVRRFHERNRHSARDGCVGPGTRRLLALRMLEAFGPRAAQRLTDPEDPPQPPRPFTAYDYKRGQKPFLFVSYAHKDSHLVYPEIARLRGRGYRIWYDEGIEPGSVWAAEIDRAVLECSGFVVFLSRRAAASAYVAHEIDLALRRPGRPFLAVLLRPTPLPEPLGAKIGHLQAIHRHEMSPESYAAKMDQALQWFVP
jgi:hypothetical protein